MKHSKCDCDRWTPSKEAEKFAAAKRPPPPPPPDTDCGMVMDQVIHCRDPLCTRAFWPSAVALVMSLIVVAFGVLLLKGYLEIRKDEQILKPNFPSVRVEAAGEIFAHP